MLDDLMAKAKDPMNVVENVVAGVPGIKGYKEKELRRETDKTVRTMVARQLDDQKARVAAHAPAVGAATMTPMALFTSMRAVT